MRLLGRDRLRRPSILELAATLVAWVAEAGLVLIVARSAGMELSVLDAVLVTCVW